MDTGMARDGAASESPRNEESESEATLDGPAFREGSFFSLLLLVAWAGLSQC